MSVTRAVFAQDLDGVASFDFPSPCKLPSFPYQVGARLHLIELVRAAALNAVGPLSVGRIQRFSAGPLIRRT
jgi:hypothetical protein